MAKIHEQAALNLLLDGKHHNTASICDSVGYVAAKATNTNVVRKALRVLEAKGLIQHVKVTSYTSDGRKPTTNVWQLQLGVSPQEIRATGYEYHPSAQELAGKLRNLHEALGGCAEWLLCAAQLLEVQS